MGGGDPFGFTGGGGGLGDLFDAFFGGGGGGGFGRGPVGPPAGADLEVVGRPRLRAGRVRRRGRRSRSAPPWRARRARPRARSRAPSRHVRRVRRRRAGAPGAPVAPRPDGHRRAVPARAAAGARSSTTRAPTAAARVARSATRPTPSTSRRASTPAPPCASRASVRSARGAARRATSTCTSGCAPTTASSATATTCIDELHGAAHPGGARRPPRLRDARRHRGARAAPRHPDRPARSASAARACPTCRAAAAATSLVARRRRHADDLDDEQEELLRQLAELRERAGRARRDGAVLEGPLQAAVVTRRRALGPVGRRRAHAFVADLDRPGARRPRPAPPRAGGAPAAGRRRSPCPTGAAGGAACRFGDRARARRRGRRSWPGRKPAVTVAFALVKGERPEWVTQKLTELGVDTIVPFTAARSVVRWDDRKAAANRDRLERVAREAAMQSRRCWLPEVASVATFADGGRPARGRARRPRRRPAHPAHAHGARRPRGRLDRRRAQLPCPWSASACRCCVPTPRPWWRARCSPRSRAGLVAPAPTRSLQG